MPKEVKSISKEPQNMLEQVLQGGLQKPSF